MQGILKRIYSFLEKEFDVPNTQIDVEIPGEFIQKIKENKRRMFFENFGELL